MHTIHSEEWGIHKEPIDVGHKSPLANTTTAEKGTSTLWLPVLSVKGTPDDLDILDPIIVDEMA